MSILTIEGIDERTIERLRAEASRRSQSVESYALDLLRNSVRSRQEIAAELRRIRAMTPPTPQTDSTALIRQIRDE